MLHRARHGWVEVVAGVMFSGKSEELIRRVRRTLIAGRRVQLFKSHLDDRYGGQFSISSHDGRQIDAEPVSNSVQVAEKVRPATQVVAIDEAQFLDDGICEVADALADAGMRVIVAGTDMDFRGEPFGPMGLLLARAERIDKLHAICVVCGDPATRNQRLIDGKPAPAEGPTIQVGGAESYEARCRRCHEVPKRTRAQAELLLGRGAASRCLIIAVLAIAGFGCRDDSQNTGNPDVPAESASVFLADSASVDIVRISNLHALNFPQVEKRLIYSTAADLEFDHVVGAVFLPDSSLVVADRGSSELTFLDRDGNVRTRTGREGEGPGEYTRIARIGIGADGSLFVYDRRQRRFTFLDSQGRVAGVKRIERSGEVLPLVRLQSGQSLALFEPRPPLAPGLQRGPLFLVLGDDSWEVVDTLGVWVGKERHLSRESGEIVVGFGATALFDGRGLHTVVGTNDSLDVTLYQGLSPLTRIRGGHSPRQVTAQEKEAWTELYLAMFPEGWRADRRRELEQSTVRETYPAFGALSVDADGRIWIGDFARLAEPQRRWTVLGPGGRPIGALSLPVFRPEWYRFREGLSAMGTGSVEVTTSLPKPRHELLDVTAGRIAILRRGELAGEFIEVYEVEIPR